MYKYFPLFFSIYLLLSSGMKAQNFPTIKLPNGWAISMIGKSLPLGDLPLNIAVSNAKKLFAVTNNGQSTQTIQLFDAVKLTMLDSIVIKKSWLGLKFSSNDKYLYASGGNDNIVIRYQILNKKLSVLDTFVVGKPLPEKISVAGIEVDDSKQKLYVVTKDNNSLYVINLTTKKVELQKDLGGEGYTCILSPDKKNLYISCWGGGKVLVFDTQKQTITDAIPVGSNPNDMCITKKGDYLFVANANDNSVSVIDTKNKKVIETLNTALYPNAPSGCTTNSVALNQKDNVLYIANADNNCLAVFDVTKAGSSKSMGFIPTGWYPTCVRIVSNNLLVSNGKGFTSLANPYGPDPTKKTEKVNYQSGENFKKEKIQYIGSLFQGTLSIIGIPDQKQLAVYSQTVYQNTPYSKKSETEAEGSPTNPIPTRLGNPSPIKYVFYVIKENRTYDQVLSDVAGGNGDTSLLIFGKKITPNQHSLVENFVLLDNFYTNGEVSADGHNWTMGAYATDFLEKTWPTSYGRRGGSYDAEGNRAIANNKNGFLWDMCKKQGVTYRTYGEFAENYKANIPVLKGHFCTYFTGWNTKVMDTTRFSQWKREFDSLLLVGKVPQLNTLRFPNDHTEGLKKGHLSPYAMVADNDLAVGLFVEHLSNSPIWKETVIFIVEDDAQNGPDHVDAHRTTAYVAGGYVKRNFIDHTMYSTSSMLHTIEMILGLPPMSQYDAAAPTMWRCFTDTANLTPFKSLPTQIDLKEKNISMNKWSRMSEEYDFSMEDRVPDDVLNEIIWAATKGENAVCPAPKRAAFFKVTKNEDDDDD